MHEWLQFAIGALIVAAVFFAVRRNGQLNPHNTGSLGRQNKKLFAEVGAIKASIANLATRAEVTALAGDLRELEAKTASSAEVGGVVLKVTTLRSDMEGGFKALDEKVNGIAKSSDRTYAAVDRIEGMIMKKGMGE
jgi:hypothetical protein